MEDVIKVDNKKRLIDRLPTWLTNIHSMLYYFLFLILLGIVFFSSSLFVNYFTTPFTGDYVSQQFAFYTNGYDDWWHFIKTGEFVMYDTNTFLGVDNLGANTFYYLFNPFFLPILLVPRQFIPQGMAILTIFKMAACGMTFFLYMRYLGASRKASKITGLAYAFCGWITWYLWFNHFTDVAIVLPLILLGVEIVLKEKKPWVLGGAICLIGFVNYFFCISFIMCTLLYGGFRYFQQIKKNNWKNNLLIAGLCLSAIIVGFLMASMVIIPSTIKALSSPRASGGSYSSDLKDALKNLNFRKVFELLFSWTATSSGDKDKARSLYPFIEFIFPVTSCRGTPLTVYYNETYDNVSGSFYCFIPMIMLLPRAVMYSFKKKHYSVIAPILFFGIGLFTPFLYYLFHGFTQAYSRWSLFVSTSILAYTGLYLDKLDEEQPAYIFIGWSFVVLIVLAASLSANYIVASFNSFKERVPIWLAALIEIVYATILTIVLFIIKNKKKPGFYNVFAGFLVTEIVAMGAFVIQGHGVANYYKSNKSLFDNNSLSSLISKVNKDDQTYFRSYSSLMSTENANDGMRNGYNGLSFYHSVYNYNTADICNWSSISTDQAPLSYSGVYLQKRPYLDTLLGVKYYYVKDNYFEYRNNDEATSSNFRYNVPLEYLDISGNYGNKNFKVYKNYDYIDFALSYDKVYKTNGDPTINDSYENLYSKGDKQVLLNEELYLSGAIINEHNDTSVIPYISEEHKDVSVEAPLSKSLNDYYSLVKMQHYSDTPDYSFDAMITYYDIKKSGRNSMDLSLKELVALDRNNTSYNKLSDAYLDIDNGYQRWIATIETLGTNLQDYDPKGNIYYLNLPYTVGNDFDVYFVDTENKIVTYDNHNDDVYTNARAGKEWRCFYVAPQYQLVDGELVVVKGAPKIKKIVIVARNTFIPNNISLLIDTYTKHQNKLTDLKSNLVTDVVYKTNSFSFKTNYEKERLVVTRLAYEKGFSLKMIDGSGKKTNVRVFNAQGGFVSFVSGTGNCSYLLEYETPNIELSSLLSAIGVFVYLNSIVGYIYFDLKKKEKELFNPLKR